jgi:hypothetical protein
MRSFLGVTLFAGCVVVGTVAFVAAQDQAPPPGAAGQAGGAQGGGRAAPPPPQNLKVLPKSWTRQQVQAVMNTFVESLGQTPPAQGAPAPPKGQGEGCLHCHVPGKEPGPGGRGPAPDFVSDENPNKDIARKMIQMVMAANDNFLKSLGDTAVPEKVSCFTCHRGDFNKPAMQPAAGWGRGSFTLLPAGPTVPAPGAGRRGN